MVKWEYDILILKMSMGQKELKGAEQINEMAEEGWELFNVQSMGLGWPVLHYFRREKK